MKQKKCYRIGCFEIATEKYADKRSLCWLDPVCTEHQFHPETHKDEMASRRDPEIHSLGEVSQEDHDTDGVQDDDEEICGSENEGSYEEDDEVESKCPEGICDGSGEIATDVLDQDSHQLMRGVGTEKCLCRKLAEEDEETDTQDL